MAQLTGQGPIALPQPTSEVATTPYPIQLGSRARDLEGSEYVYVDLTGPVFSGQPVEITDSHTAEVVGTTGRGRVGVATCAGTSDNAVWVQIYGLCTIQLGMSGVSPSDAANGPTTLDTTAITRFILATSLSTPNGIGWTTGNTSLSSGHWVEGIHVAQSADPTAVTATTSAASNTGNNIAVFLNYPEIVNRNYGE